MALESIKQQPHDKRDYDISFADWWPDGDLVSSVVLTATPSGLSLGYATAGQSLKVWIGPGVEGLYKVTAVVTSTAVPSRIKEIDLKVRIKDE